MLERLSDGPASVGELAKPLNMSLAAVMQHLQLLQDLGIVRSEKVGRVRVCQLAPDALRPAEQWLSARHTTWEHRLDQLGEVLGKQSKEPGK